VFERTDSDPRRNWRIISNIMHKRRDDERFSIVINSVTYDHNDRANAFNEYFLNVGQTNQPEQHSTLSFDPQYMPLRADSDFSFSEVSEHEVALVISRLKENSATGFDDISSKVIKRTPGLIKPLHYLVNLMITAHYFPDLLKVARVVVVYKSGARNEAGNYRPISVLSVFSKIFESLLYSELYSYIEDNRLLSTFQYGFRRGYSTEQALLKIKENILYSFEKGQYTIGLFFDIRKAFDSLDHRRLLAKLEHYGIRNQSLKLLKHYLQGRKQYVILDGVVSSLGAIRSGVPQGSNLGPLLFILYINDFINIYPNADYVMFADDTNLFLKNDNLDDLEAECNTVCNNALQWSRINLLKLNESKTKLVIFRPKNKVMREIAVVLGSHPIQIVDQIKFLGVILDSQLRWENHIDYLCAQLKKTCGLIGRLKQLFPSSVKKRLYYALFYSRIYYCILVYGTAAETHLQRIHILQNRFIKHITNLPWDANHRDLYNKHKLLSIHVLFVYRLLLSMRKGSTLYNALMALCNLSVFISSSYNFRNKNTYVVPFCKNKYSEQSLRYTVPVVLNEFENKLVELKSVSEFKKKLIDILLTQPCCDKFSILM